MIPQSRYVLVPTYFRAKLVEGFREEYIQHLMELDGYSQHGLAKEGLESVISLWIGKDSIGELELYMHPDESLSGIHCSVQTQKLLEQEADFFEREDDNWVIPRHLFEPI